MILPCMIAGGCAHPITSQNMSEIAISAQEIRQFDGIYQNEAKEPDNTMAHVRTLWQLITSDFETKTKHEDMVRIELRSDDSLLAILIEDGTEKGRQQISVRFEDGYLLRGDAFDTPESHSVAIAVVSHSFGMGLDPNGALLTLWHSEGTLLFPFIFGADSGSPVRSTFARVQQLQQPTTRS